MWEPEHQWDLLIYLFIDEIVSFIYLLTWSWLCPCPPAPSALLSWRWRAAGWCHWLLPRALLQDLLLQDLLLSESRSLRDILCLDMRPPSHFEPLSLFSRDSFSEHTNCVWKWQLAMNFCTINIVMKDELSLWLIVDSYLLQRDMVLLDLDSPCSRYSWYMRSGADW